MTSKKIIPALFLFLNSAVAIAQHCPFDGTNILLMNITGASKNKINTNAAIYLQEIVTDKNQKCTYIEDAIKIAFKPIDSIYKENSWIKNYEKNEGAFKNYGQYYVLMDWTQAKCVSDLENSTLETDRKWEIVYIDKKTKNQKSVPMKQNNIKKMCVEGKWLDLKAIEL